ncbi:MAG: SAM-dependent methyltransferase [Desulfobacterales bacterium]|nr:SAM-dependent methyltransferase [Desulfobacterales bacterium]
MENRQKWNPGALFKLSGSYWNCCTLHAAVKLDIFTIIGDDTLPADDVASLINGSARGTEMLLNAVSAMGLLNKADGLYKNTPASTEWLSKTSPKYIGFMIMHHHHLVDSWFQLDESVKTGKPARDRASFSEEETRESFLMGMFNLAMGLAPEIVSKIDLSEKKRLLDLGGGPGTYAIHFCQKNPGLTAVVYDLPTTKPFAEKTINKFDLSDRIRFNDGNFITKGIEGTYDVAWLSHILHGEGPEDCFNLIQKAVDVLESGGMIVIHEFILNNEMDGPLFPALFSLNMLTGTPSGQAYSERQLGDMLKNAGIKQIHRIAVTSPNDSGIIAGFKP